MNPSSTKHIERLQKQFAWVIILSVASAVMAFFAIRDGLWFSDYLAGICVVLNLILIQMSRWGLASELKRSKVQCYYRGERFSLLVLGILSFSFLLLGTLVYRERFILGLQPVVLLVLYVVGLRIFPPLVFCTTEDSLYAFNVPVRKYVPGRLSKKYSPFSMEESIIDFR